MDVPDELAKIAFALAKNGLVPALKDMPDAPITPIVILAVSRQKPLHNAPDRFRLPFDQKMNVIRHQAIGIKIERRPLLLLRQQREEFNEIFPRMKYVLPVVAARDHMIQTTLDLNPQFSRHTRKILHQKQKIAESNA
jgi:hypothetical protein